MPMTLNLYNYNSEDDIDTIFNWSPNDPQWWITGFNPQYVGNVDVTKQVSIGSVDFSQFTDADGNNEMYDKLKNIYETNDELSQYVYFDKSNQIMWICWYEGALAK